MNAIQIIKNGIVKENPTFVLMLGMCPTLATTTSAMNGMSMGLATMAVLDAWYVSHAGHHHLCHEWYVDGLGYDGCADLHQLRDLMSEVDHAR